MTERVVKKAMRVRLDKSNDEGPRIKSGFSC
jgi:hypothetical protein